MQRAKALFRDGAIEFASAARHQIILERCVFDEARVADAASSLGLTIGSAKSTLYRARRRVSDSFARRGLIKRRNFPKYAGAVTERLKNAENL